MSGRRRAEILARTEIIRSHHLATIEEYRTWEVEGVYVLAEWATAGDSRVCTVCAPLQGTIWTLDEIEPMIPRHPQCRCVSIPFVDKTRTKVGGQ
jgi:SPP1 gp7 family putative phage head morphogenesis protein